MEEKFEMVKTELERELENLKKSEKSERNTEMSNYTLTQNGRF